MKWLSPRDAEKLLPGYGGEPQAFLFDCADCDLAARLPVEPRHLSTDDGEPSPTHQWAALIDDRRPVVIQQKLPPGRGEPNPVPVLTPYPPPGAAEWGALRELAVLPEPIQARRPLFIQSRSASRDHVVLRPNERGWNDVVYRAASRAEAEDLLDYLRRRDPAANRDCFIG